MRKLLLAILTLFLMFGTVSAGHIDFPDLTVNYYEDDLEDATIYCNMDEGDCPQEDVTVCDRNWYVAHEATGGSVFGDDDTLEYRFQDDSWIGEGDYWNIPQDMHCGYGTHEFSVAGESGGELRVEPSSEMVPNPHRGDNLVVNLEDSDGDHGLNVRNFHLTNDVWDSGYTAPDDSTGSIFLQNHGLDGFDPSEQGHFTLEPGEDPVISRTQDLATFSSDNQNVGGDATDGGAINAVLSQGFQEADIFFFSDGFSSEDGGILSSSPVHEDAYYRPQGEIVLGYEPEAYGGVQDVEEYDYFSPAVQEQYVITKTDDNYRVNPLGISNSIEMVWDGGLEEGQDDNKMSHTLSFEDEGHARIEYRNEDEGLLAAFNTDAEGDNSVWFHCAGCDEGVFDGGYDPSANYGRLPVTYSTDNEYTFKAEETVFGPRYSIEQDGEEVWSHTDDGVVGFDSSSLETWYTWDGTEGDVVRAPYNIEAAETSGGPDNQRFYICREGATVKNGFGDEVPQTVDTTGDGTPDYRCNEDAGIWFDSAACDSGLDHDDDGRIDAPSSNYHENIGDGSVEPDPLCESTDDDKGAESKCRGAVMVDEANDEPTPDGPGWKVLYEDEDGECNLDPDDILEGLHIDDLDIDQDSDKLLHNFKDEPEIFTCDEDDGAGNGNEIRSTACNQADLGLYEDPEVSCDDFNEDDGDEEGCNDRPECAWHVDDVCRADPSDHEKDYGKMPMVEYYADPGYFEQLAIDQEGGAEPGTVVTDSKFVEPGEGWRTQADGLWEDAENEYAPSGATTDIEKHEESTWSDLGMTDAEVYEDESFQSNVEAWVPSNAGADTQDVTSTADDGSDSVFPGGFAGKCEEEQQWQWDEDDLEWRCSGNILWDQAMMMPTLTSGDYLGMAVMPYNYLPFSETDPAELPGYIQNLQWESYSTAYHGFHGEEDELSELRAMCWPGPAGQRDEEIADGNYISGTINLNPNMDDDSTPTGIYGEVDDVSHVDTYSCYWEYETDNYDAVSDSGDVVELHFMDEDDTEREVFTEEYDIEESFEYSGDDWAEQMSNWGNPNVNAEGDYSDWDLEVE